MSQTLYRKYRPQTWFDIAGQAHIKDTLAFEVASGQLAHAYLLAGPRGVGKTTTARIFAKAVNCTNRKKDSGEPCNKCESCLAVTEGGSLDIIEIDAASHTGVDSVRENIVENSRFAPSRLKNKVFIIDEVHMLSTSAFNALLKTLEEPPPNVMFMLATTELHKIPATVISRCQRFDFRKISVMDVVERLKMIAASEKIKVDDSVLAEIARLSEGCLRDAESLFGKLLAVTDGKKITDKEVASVLPRSDWEAAANFVDSLVAGETATALTIIGECLDSGADVEQFAGEVTELLRKAMLVKLSGSTDAFKIDLDESRLERIAGWAKSADLAFLVRALETMLVKRRELKGSHPVQLPLELAAVLICEQPSMNTPPPKPVTAGEVTKKNVILSEASGPRDSKNDEDSPPPPTSPPTSSSSTTNNHSEPEENKEAAQQAASADSNVVIASAAPQSRDSKQTAQPEDPVTTIEEVKKVWQDLVSKVSGVSQSLVMLLNSVKPTEVVGRKVRIGASFAFYKDKINDDKTRAALEEALSNVLGKQVLVEGVTLEKSEQMVHNDVAERLVPEQEVADLTPEQADRVAKIAANFGGEVLS